MALARREEKKRKGGSRNIPFISYVVLQEGKSGGRLEVRKRKKKGEGGGRAALVPTSHRDIGLQEEEKKKKKGRRAFGVALRVEKEKEGEVGPWRTWLVISEKEKGRLGCRRSEKKKRGKSLKVYCFYSVGQQWGKKRKKKGEWSSTRKGRKKNGTTVCAEKKKRKERHQNQSEIGKKKRGKGEKKKPGGAFT